MKHAIEAYNKVIAAKPKTLLDVGTGNDEHATPFKDQGIKVTTVDNFCPADFQGDYLKYGRKKFDCVWSSHMLEHNTNPGLILKKMHSNLKEGGLLAITVPPSVGSLVIGHPIKWDIGHLLYNLVLAGFDCSEAKAKKYGYNLSVILMKKSIQLNDIHMGRVDMEQINKYLPQSLQCGQASDVGAVNW